MQHQAEAERWLRSGHEDLGYARHAAANGFHAPACFHAQQAAEKAVKAVHYGRGARAVIGHSVRRLVETLVPRAPELDQLLDAARELDLLYLPTRYPNGLDSGTPGEAFGETQSRAAIGHAARLAEAAGRLVAGRA
jgi:HEPN domain-containing protein